ncbi:hypothetical protein BVC80_8847g24 [Macleaya cordata]|uniref:Uncharacterized protein n=1 Tax=Macleaya cordata TaxID=56857 RepID=A0A200PZY1_MACCD|nr:hypothetical protein BVC80_8847g24 [Macleaya cordata]
MLFTQLCADGAMIFCNGSLRGLRHLMKLLGDYQASTRQLGSREKRSVYGEISQQVAFKPRSWDQLRMNFYHLSLATPALGAGSLIKLPSGFTASSPLIGVVIFEVPCMRLRIGVQQPRKLGVLRQAISCAVAGRVMEILSQGPRHPQICGCGLHNCEAAQIGVECYWGLSVMVQVKLCCDGAAAGQAGAAIVVSDHGAHGSVAWCLNCGIGMCSNFAAEDPLVCSFKMDFAQT